MCPSSFRLMSVGEVQHAGAAAEGAISIRGVDERGGDARQSSVRPELHPRHTIRASVGLQRVGVHIGSTSSERDLNEAGSTDSDAIREALAGTSGF